MVIDVYVKLPGINSYRAAGLIDSWTSLRILENWYKPDEMTLILPETSAYKNLILPDTALLIEGVFYRVESVFTQKQELTIKGRSLSAQLEDLIIKGTYRTQQSAGAILEDLVKRYGNLSFLSLKTNSQLAGEFVRFQNSHGELLKVIVKLCETYDIGYYEQAESAETPNATLQFSAGRDVSQLVEFSSNYDNFQQEEFERSVRGVKNVAYVFGEGEGSERLMEVVDQSAPGEQKRELYVDARDLQRKQDDVLIPESEYRQMLRQRGCQKLSDTQAVFALKGEINVSNQLFRLGLDYRLGDLVTVRSIKHKVIKKIRLMALQKTYDSDGEHIEPVFGKELPTLLDKIGG